MLVFFAFTGGKYVQIVIKLISYTNCVFILKISSLFMHLLFLPEASITSSLFYFYRLFIWILFVFVS